VNPHNSYAISKYSQELIALNLGRRYSIPTVALRYSITVGPRQSFHNAYSGACRIFTMRALAGEPLLVYEDGKQLRDYVHIDDVVAANLLVLKNDAADYRVFNVGGGKAVTVVDLADMVLRSTGREARLDIPGKFRVGDTRHVVSSIGAMGSIGWKPRKSCEEAVKDYVNWVSNQEELRWAYKEADRTMAESGVVRTAAKL
jgi:dTDP-L-rhamnose 4-epimerase